MPQLHPTQPNTQICCKYTQHNQIGQTRYNGAKKMTFSTNTLQIKKRCKVKNTNHENKCNRKTLHIQFTQTSYLGLRGKRKVEQFLTLHRFCMCRMFAVNVFVLGRCSTFALFGCVVCICSVLVYLHVPKCCSWVFKLM